MIPALVLTAGLATRLRPLSFVRAKAALPVAGEPLIRRILRQLAEQQVTEVVLNLHHLPASLTGILGDGADLGMHIRYSWESPVLGSAGGPRRALPLLGSATFLILNGDTLTDLDVRPVVERHRETNTLVTMAVTPNTEPDKYGGVLVDADDNVTGFCRRGSPQPSFHFFGIQVVEARAFDRVPPQVPYESTSALYPALIAERRGSVQAFRCSPEYFDIGTPSDYLATSLALAARDGAGAQAGSSAHIHPTAIVERSILWEDVTVGAGAMLRECIVTDGVHVPADTSWHGVTIRKPGGELATGEVVIEGLAIASL